MKKTNAIRELEIHKIEHIVREYEVDEEHLDNVRGFVTKMGAEFGAVFDALWTHGDENRLERIAEAQLATAQMGGVRR